MVTICKFNVKAREFYETAVSANQFNELLDVEDFYKFVVAPAFGPKFNIDSNVTAARGAGVNSAAQVNRMWFLLREPREQVLLSIARAKEATSETINNDIRFGTVFKTK